MTIFPEEVVTETRDAACVVAYRRLRHGVSTSRQIGYGRNMYPAAPELVAQIRALITVLFEQQRMTDYSTGFDGSDRHLISALAAEWLGRFDIGPGDVFVMSGSTEAISVVTGYLAGRGYEYVLPLPCYYAFEQSARRWGMPVGAHYNGDGLLHGTRSGAPEALVDIVPNGVTGRRFRLPDGAATTSASSIRSSRCPRRPARGPRWTTGICARPSGTSISAGAASCSPRARTCRSPDCARAC